MNEMLEGVVTAVVTPMSKNGGRVDFKAIPSYVDFLVEKGVNAIFVNGTTSEGLLLSIEERKRVLETFLKAADGRIKVVAHCGALRIKEVLALIDHAQKSGVDGVGVVTPFYYRLSEEEIENFYAKIGEKFQDIPIYLYNIPGLTNNWINARIATHLHKKFPNIMGVKDSSGNFSHVLSLINDTPKDFSVLTGYDRAFVSVLFAGGKGCVSGPATVFPEFFVEVWKNFKAKKYARAKEFQKKLTKLSLALGDGANISLLKAALKWRGVKVGGVRTPLLDLGEDEAEAYKKNISEVLKEVGLNWKA
jgi:4-hydroxy-tetrahydrodipicolinate synthase